KKDLAGGHVDHIGGNLAANVIIKIGFLDIDFFDEVEQVENLFVARMSEGTDKHRDREFLLAVDVGPQDVIDIGRKLNPASAEGDDTAGIDRRTVRVEALGEEDARGTVELAHHDAFGAVNDERTFLRHHRQVTE